MLKKFKVNMPRKNSPGTDEQTFTEDFLNRVKQVGLQELTKNDVKGNQRTRLENELKTIDLILQGYDHGDIMKQLNVSLSSYSNYISRFFYWDKKALANNNY
ncbi:MAG: hypothetical protein ABH828_00990 [archaeon]